MKKQQQKKNNGSHMRINQARKIQLKIPPDDLGGGGGLTLTGAYQFMKLKLYTVMHDCFETDQD